MNEQTRSYPNKRFAILFARLVLGLIFLMAGVYKVFDLGPMGHVQKYFLPFEDTFLPTWWLWVVGFTIPFVEFIAGAMVIVGWKTRYALISLGIILVIVTFGHLLKDPLYPFHEHVVPRLGLVLFLLVMPEDADFFSLDEIIRNRKPQRV